MRISDWSSDVCSSDLNFIEYLDSSYEVKSLIGDESIFQHYREWYATRGVSRNHADLVSGVVSRNKHIEYALYDEIPRRVSIIGSPLDGYTICLSFHHAMCDATSDSKVGSASCRERVCQYV